MVCFPLSFHLSIPLASLQVPGKPNFGERQLLTQPHVLLRKTPGLVLNTKSTNSNRTKGDYWSAEVSVVGWGHGAWATDENFLLPVGDGPGAELGLHICNWVNGIWTCLIYLSQCQWGVTVTEYTEALNGGQKHHDISKQQ